MIIKISNRKSKTRFSIKPGGAFVQELQDLISYQLLNQNDKTLFIDVKITKTEKKLIGYKEK